MDHVTIATRRSPLALAQSNWVAGVLRASGRTVTLLELVTTGDRWSAAGATDATRGLFVKELEEALLDGRADIAVHSAKDVPGDLPEGLAIVAVPAREDPRDVVVGPVGGLDALSPGAVVGTGSPRRVAQLQLAYPNLTFREIRGNVGTRLHKREAGEFDALVLAAAGLNRLGLTPQTTTPIDITLCVPAPGQGALALEACSDRTDVQAATATLRDAATQRCVDIERAVLAGLGGGCREPVGALAQPTQRGINLTIFAADGDDTSRFARHNTLLSAHVDADVDAAIAQIRATLQG